MVLAKLVANRRLALRPPTRPSKASKPAHRPWNRKRVAARIQVIASPAAGLAYPPLSVATVNRQEILTRTQQHVRHLLSGDGTGHDWHHIDRVRRVALRLADAEGADPFVVELAALLHDVADWKFHGGDETAGPRAAREWLASLDVDEATIDHVCGIVAGLSFKGAGVATEMPTVEGRVVQDADRLDAIGAIGVARTFAYGGHRGQPLHDPDLPPTLHDSFAAYKQPGGTSLNHFHEKLLLLKDRMQTASGRRWAETRHAYLEAFVERFLQEWNGNDGPRGD